MFEISKEFKWFLPYWFPEKTWFPRKACVTIKMFGNYLDFCTPWPCYFFCLHSWGGGGGDIYWECLAIKRSLENILACYVNKHKAAAVVIFAELDPQSLSNEWLYVFVGLIFFFMNLDANSLKKNQRVIVIPQNGPEMLWFKFVCIHLYKTKTLLSDTCFYCHTLPVWSLLPSTHAGYCIVC